MEGEMEREMEGEMEGKKEGEMEGQMEGKKKGEMESEMEGKREGEMEGEMEGNGENDANIKIDDDEQEEARAENAIPEDVNLDPAIEHNTSLAPAIADNTSLAPATADNTSLAPATADNISLAPAIADNAGLVLATADDVSLERSLNLCVFQFYYYAKFKRSDTIQEMLCKPGISINATDSQGRSALMFANDANDQCAQEILLANGAIPPPTTPPISDLLKSEPSQDVRVRQVFEAACLDYSYPEFLSVVLTEGAIGVNELNENGRTALMMAVEDGHLNAVSILIKAGANVSEWVVRRALDLNRLDIMELLLRASPTLCDALWLEVLWLPSCQMHRALVEAERESLPGTRIRLADPLLARAVRLRSMEAVLRLIEAGVDVNAVDRSGRTAVHAAVSYSTVELLKVLIENGADVNSQDNAMNTPLDLALKSDGAMDEIVQELRLAGAVAGTVAGTVAGDVDGAVAGDVDGAVAGDVAGPLL